jgi:hypothetical protein
MNAAEISSQAEVGAVIHDQAYATVDTRLLLKRHPAQFPSLREHLTRVAALIAVLDKGHATCD